MESHLPQTSEEVGSVLTSPQFQQALGTFGSALQSGQLGPLMNQFGLGGQVVRAANSGGKVWQLVNFEIGQLVWLRLEQDSSLACISAYTLGHVL